MEDGPDEGAKRTEEVIRRVGRIRETHCKQKDIPVRKKE